MPMILGVCIVLITFISGNSMHDTESMLDARRAPIIDRILGGVVASVNQLPYIVTIIRNGQHDCGGSIVSEHYVLTAAHCIHRKDKYIIRAGTDLWTTKGNDHSVSEFIVHPNNTKENIKHYDIALIKVNPPFKFHTEVRPVRLPKQGVTPPPGTKVLVSGWGAISLDPPKMPIDLHAVMLNIISNEDCQNYYDDEIMPFMLCAGFDGGGRDACFGDSGGPLVDQNGSQVGIVSWGPEGMCASPEQPYGVYTHVALMRNWIAQITGV